MKVSLFRNQVFMTVIFSCATIGSATADTSVTTITTSTSAMSDAGTGALNQAPGTVVYFRAIPQSLLVSTLQGRTEDLKSKIDRAYASGQINSEQYESMKEELRRIAQETSTNTITYPSALMLAQDLDFIGQQYGTVVTAVPTYVPLIIGSSFTVASGQTFQLDDLSRRRADLEITISKYLMQRRLTTKRATELRSQLAAIGSQANLYMADGSFNSKESRNLYDAFDRVAQEIENSASRNKN